MSGGTRNDDSKTPALRRDIEIEDTPEDGKESSVRELAPNKSTDQYLQMASYLSLPRDAEWPDLMNEEEAPFPVDEPGEEPPVESARSFEKRVEDYLRESARRSKKHLSEPPPKGD